MRRFILAAAALLALGSATPPPAEAFLFRTGGGSNIQIVPPAVSVTRTNLSGSSTPAESFVSYGQSFAPGEIASGSSPKVLVGGSAVTTQADNILYHGDGSMRWARLSYRVGSAAGYASLVDTVSAQNTPPSTSCGRSTSDVSAADIDVQLTGLTNYGGGTEGSGTWKARVNDAISDGGISVRQVASGPVNCEWMFVTAFKDTTGGAVHPHLFLLAFVRAWTNSDTTLGPLEYRAGVVNGWLGSNLPAIGTSTSTNTIASTGSVSFTTQAGLKFYNGMVVAARRSAGNYMIGTVTSYDSGTGALTLNLVSKKGSGTASSWDLVAPPTSFTFTAALRTGGGAVTVRSVSGIQMAHNSGAWISQANGLRDWSDGRTPFQMAINPTYAIKSNLFPPYDPAIVSPVADASYTPATYSPMISGYVGATADARNGRGFTADANYYNGAASITAATNTSGDREDIGLMPAWASRAFVNQGANHLQTDRVRALSALHMTIARLNPATNKVAVLDNGPDDAGGTFSGMGADFNTSYQNNNTSQISNDLIIGTGGTNGWQGTAGPGSLVDAEHLPSLVAMQYLQTGDPEYLLLQQMVANQVLFGQNPSQGRNMSYVVSAVTYRSNGLVCGNGSNVRSDAWGRRELALAATLTPTANAESAYFLKLYGDNATGCYNLHTVYYPSISKYAAAFPSLGLYWFPELPGVSGSTVGGQQHMFMQHYVMEDLCFEYMLTGNSTALAHATYLQTNYTGMIASGWGSDLYAEGYYRGGYVLDETARQTVGTFARIGFYEPQSTVDNGAYVMAKTTAGSSVVTLVTNGGSTTTSPLFKLVANDNFRPTPDVPNSSLSTNGAAPSPELSFGTVVYVKTATFGSSYGLDSATGMQTITSGTNTITLSATEGGAAIVFSADSTFNFLIEHPQSVPPGELAGGAGFNGPGSAGNLAVAAQKLASYIGLPNAAANLAALEAVITGYPGANNKPSNNNKISFLRAAP